MNNEHRAIVEAVHRTLRAQCQDDYVGLWSLLRDVQSLLPTDEATARDIALSALHRALADGGIVFGHFRSDRSFEQWTGTPGAIVDRINESWTSLGHTPDIGDVGWLTSKEISRDGSPYKTDGTDNPIDGH